MIQNTATIDIPLASIELDDPALQLRQEWDIEVIEDYAEAMKKESKFPAIWVIRAPENPDRYLVVDGQFRVRAARQIELQSIKAQVLELSKAEAFEAAIKQNVQQGKCLSRADKRMLVKRMCQTRSNQSSRHIAGLLGVSVDLVQDVRELSKTDNSTSEEVRIGRDGKNYKAKRKKPSEHKAPAASTTESMDIAVASPAEVPEPTETVDTAAKPGDGFKELLARLYDFARKLEEQPRKFAEAIEILGRTYEDLEHLLTDTEPVEIQQDREETCDHAENGALSRACD